MSKIIIDMDYENELCMGITIEGSIDKSTKENEKTYFQRIVYAHWIPSKNNNIYRCSACKCTSCIPEHVTYEHCPACGAVMDEEELTDEV